jgi:signal peptidase I
MEPTLFPGDVLVVRKSDGIWQRWRSSRTVGGGETNTNEKVTDYDEQAIQREKILAYERKHCNSNGFVGLLRKPPTPVNGNIVVFKDPQKYPDRWNVERVVGVGGETVRLCI